jgi:hypothetical protein
MKNHSVGERRRGFLVRFFTDGFFFEKKFLGARQKKKTL